MLTKEDILKQRETLLLQYNQILGAMSLCDNLLKQIQDKEAVPQDEELVTEE